MGKKGGSSPAAPPPIDPGKSMGEYLFGKSFSGSYQGITDPRLQERLIGAERTYRPQYTALELADIGVMARGLEAGAANPEYARLEAELAGLRAGQEVRGSRTKADIEAEASKLYPNRKSKGRPMRGSQNANRNYNRQQAEKRAAFIKSIGDPGEDRAARIAQIETQMQDMSPTLEGTPGLFDLLEEQSTRAGALQREQLGLQRESDVAALEEFAPQVVEAYRAADPYSTELADLGSERAKGLIGAERSEAEQLLGQRGLEFAASTGELTPLEQRRATQSAREASTARGRGMDQSALYGEMQSRMSQEMNKQEREMAMGSQLLGQQAGLQQQRFGQEQAALGGAFGMQRQMAGDVGMTILGRPSQSIGLGSQMLGQAQQGAAGPMGPQLFDPNVGMNMALAQRGQDVTFQGMQAQAQAAQGAGEAGMLGSVISGGATIKAAMLCIPEGETITTDEGEKSIDEIAPGDTVVGYNGEQTTVLQKHIYKEDPEAVRFVRFTLKDGGTFAVCDKHRVEGKPAGEYVIGDSVGGSEIVSLELFGGVNVSYDLLTEDAGYQMSGVPVNSMIEELSFLTKHVLSWGKIKSLLKLIFRK